MTPLSAWVLLARNASATVTVCAPPTDTSCDELLDPSVADCTPFDMDIIDADPGDTADPYDVDPDYVEWACKTACTVTTDPITDCSYDAYADASNQVVYDRWDDGSSIMRTERVAQRI